MKNLTAWHLQYLQNFEQAIDTCLANGVDITPFLRELEAFQRIPKSCQYTLCNFDEFIESSKKIYANYFWRCIKGSITYPQDTSWDITEEQLIAYQCGADRVYVLHYKPSLEEILKAQVFWAKILETDE